MTKEEKEAKDAEAKAKAEKAAAGGDDPDKEFWESEGITEDEEKEAIRSRARVLRYHDYQRIKKEKAEKPEKKNSKKWFEKD